MEVVRPALFPVAFFRPIVRLTPWRTISYTRTANPQSYHIVQEIVRALLQQSAFVCR